MSNFVMSGWLRETLTMMQLHCLPYSSIWKKVKSSPKMTDLTFIMVESLQVTAFKFILAVIPNSWVEKSTSQL